MCEHVQSMFAGCILYGSEKLYIATRGLAKHEDVNKRMYVYAWVQGWRSVSV